jgi:UDP-2-acetamido-3-amino-2,3-dideoxy-glucuronate N-acetyltransferase
MPVNNVTLGDGVTILYPDLVNIYGCAIGAGTRIGPFVEIQRDVSIGARCKISSHAFLCEGVSIEDGVFIGHGVMFTNDIYPRAVTETGELQGAQDWELVPTRVERQASIGSNATILAGITIGTGALVGAGAVVTKDVPAHAIVVGNPARVVGDTRERKRSPLGATIAVTHVESHNGSVHENVK